MECSSFIADDPEKITFRSSRSYICFSSISYHLRVCCVGGHERLHPKNYNLLLAQHTLQLVLNIWMQNKELMENLPKEKKRFLKTAIPYSSIVERMGVERAPVAEFDARSPAAQAFSALWAEIKKL